MKWKNPNGKSATTVATTVGGMLLGAMVSDGIVSLIHTPKATAGTDEAKKEYNMLLVKRGVIAIGGGYAAAGIDGNDTTSVFVKSMAIGAATKQGLNIVNQLAAKNDKLADTSTKTKKFIAASLGLACPGENQAQLMGAIRRSKTGIKGMKGLAVFVPNAAKQNNRIVNTY